ncbi:phosphate signaling complex protein PhoU [Lactobacillus sp. DCY120]|uniref:Phosphate-specific transport system accessory protein PhoU n=1 Tax=Bombilactobacillus apium TaxID=2675299 RepID=A0A850R171_9LACO|nr:phosphate signaling complex protein PhoU [Bombilactobacillus apium]NVY96839.1 phosphate signaling complex protein PhoU [Bombilactobacillus apium]
MRSEFATELQNLHVRFSEMAMMVSEALEKAVRALKEHDSQLAQQVIDRDQLINNREIDLEKKSFEMIALQQPVTSDLRMIITVLKASSDLERMGDHAVSIAQATLRLQGHAPMLAVEDLIVQVHTQVAGMFQQAIQAYLREDDQAAIAISQQDYTVDKLIHQLNKQCIQEMKADPQYVEDGTIYMLIANYLERMGDYVTNLCEWVVYLKQGKLTDLDSKKDF